VKGRDFSYTSDLVQMEGGEGSSPDENEER
jgi:hypothetical protein